MWPTRQVILPLPVPSDGRHHEFVERPDRLRLRYLQGMAVPQFAFQETGLRYNQAKSRPHRRHHSSRVFVRIISLTAFFFSGQSSLDI